VLSREQIATYARLQTQGHALHAQGNDHAAAQAYIAAMKLYTGQLRAPYEKFASYSALGETLSERYAPADDAKDATAAAGRPLQTRSVQALHFLELEMSKTAAVRNSFREQHKLQAQQQQQR
jgi:hypothetical protein